MENLKNQAKPESELQHLKEAALRYCQTLPGENFKIELQVHTVKESVKAALTVYDFPA